MKTTDDIDKEIDAIIDFLNWHYNGGLSGGKLGRRTVRSAYSLGHRAMSISEIETTLEKYEEWRRDNIGYRPARKNAILSMNRR